MNCEIELEKLKLSNALTALKLSISIINLYFSNPPGENKISGHLERVLDDFYGLANREIDLLLNKLGAL